MFDLVYSLQLLLVGVGVGIISAALGLGGGILMVPAFLAFVPGIDPHTAKGTSLFIIIFVSIQNSWRLNELLPEKPWRLASLFTAGSIVGSYGSAYLTALLSDDAVLLLFIVLLMILGVRTFFLQAVEVHAEEVRRRTTLTLLIGFAAGITGGATGTGGGAVLIPLALMAGIVANDRAVALSNFVMIFTSIAGSVAHLQAEKVSDAPWTIGHVCFSLVPLVFAGALLGSPLGKICNRHLTLPRRRVAMAVMLVLISLQLLYKMLSG